MPNHIVVTNHFHDFSAHVAGVPEVSERGKTDVEAVGALVLKFGHLVGLGIERVDDYAGRRAEGCEMAMAPLVPIMESGWCGRPPYWVVSWTDRKLRVCDNEECIKRAMRAHDADTSGDAAASQWWEPTLVNPRRAEISAFSRRTGSSGPNGEELP